MWASWAAPLEWKSYDSREWFHDQSTQILDEYGLKEEEAVSIKARHRSRP